MQRQPRQGITDKFRFMGPSEYRPESGFAENFQAAVGMTMLDGLSYSGTFWHDYNEQNRKKVFSLVDSGRVPAKYIDSYRNGKGELDFDSLSPALQRDYGVNDVLSRQQIMEKNQIQEDELLRYGRDVQERAGFSGKVAGVLGSITAYAMDPAFVASMLVPVGQAARGASLLTRMAIRGGKVAATEMGIEVARQSSIYNWRREMGRDYSIEEGLKEVALTTLGAGVLGSAAELAAGIGKFLNKSVVDDARSAVAAKNLEDLKNVLEQAPEGVSAKDHLSRLSDEMDTINGKGSARAEPYTEELAMKDLAKAKTYEEQQVIMDRLRTEVSTVDEITGDLVTEVKPAKEAIAEMEDINTTFRKVNDCFLNG